MLSSTDIHFIVGFLCQAHNPDDVDVILGDRLFDNTIEKNRDVDVTISYRNETGEKVFLVGIEVKYHTRPLDVTHVEQLCIKFKDIALGNNGGIVSSSGYTDAARKKAKAHSVDLYELQDWEDRDKTFENLRFHNELTHNINHNITYLSPPHIVLNADTVSSFPEAYQHYFNTNLNLCDPNGDKRDAKICDLYVQAAKTALNDAIRKIVESGVRLSDSEIITVETSVMFSDMPCIWLGDTLFPIYNAKVVGHIKQTTNLNPLVFKILLKENDKSFGAGCVITEIGFGNLVGIMGSSINTPPRFYTIPLTERLKTKIVNHRLT